MTVKELLEAIANLYSGATADALKSFKGVFYARLQRHEGPKLAAAAEEIFATFKATGVNRFPIPLDFEKLLPSQFSLKGTGGPALDLKGHAMRKANLLSDWWELQGDSIRAQHGNAVARSCEHRARQIAHDRAWASDPKAIELDMVDIDQCRRQVISSERMLAHGAYSLRRSDPALWERQMAECAHLVANGVSPSKELGRAQEPGSAPPAMVSASVDQAPPRKPADGRDDYAEIAEGENYEQPSQDGQMRVDL